MILPAGGLGVSPSSKKSPKIGGYRGLIESISAISIKLGALISLLGCITRYLHHQLAQVSLLPEHLFGIMDDAID